MNQLLETTDASFGTGVRPLRPYGRTFAVNALCFPLPPGWELRRWSLRCPRRLHMTQELFKHRAILYTADHQPFSEVDEIYQAGLLANGVADAPRLAGGRNSTNAQARGHSRVFHRRGDRLGGGANTDCFVPQKLNLLGQGWVGELIGNPQRAALACVEPTRGRIYTSGSTIVTLTSKVGVGSRISRLGSVLQSAGNERGLQDDSRFGRSKRDRGVQVISIYRAVIQFALALDLAGTAL
jgi:hypothetical protein